MPLPSSRANLAALPLILLLAGQVAPPPKPAGAHTPEEAVEMFAKALAAHDPVQLAALVDTSTKAGKKMAEFTPAICQITQSMDALRAALLEKYGKEGLPRACHAHFPDAGAYARKCLELLHAKKCDRTEKRVVIPTEHEPMTLVKDAAGFWKIQAEEQMLAESTEAMNKQAQLLISLARRALEQLPKCPTPESCAAMIDGELALLLQQERKAQGEAAKLAVPRIDAPAAAVVPEKHLTIHVDADGQPTFNGKTLTPAQLTAALKDAMAKTPGKQAVLLKADIALPYAKVRPVMDAISAAGVENIDLMGLPAPKK